jgi:exosortase O
MQTERPHFSLRLLIPLLWFALHWRVYGYLVTIFSLGDFRANQIILVIGVGLILWKLKESHWQLPFTRFTNSIPAASLVLGCAFAYLAAERWLAVNVISASLFGLGTYGILGLWLSPTRWRAGLPLALLLVLTLPFGDHLQTFLGYPLRIFTAQLVQTSLQFLHIPSLTTETILRLENSVAQIDIPCSGIKSLWTGLLFLLGVSWLERTPLNLRWLAIALVSAGLFVAANFLRVLVLVLLGQWANQAHLADLVHAPLGLAGFAGVCLTALGLLRWAGNQDLHTDPAPPAPAPSAPLTALLLIGLLACFLLYQPAQRTGLTASAPHWQFPADWQAQPQPLTPAETYWLTQDGADSAQRYQLNPASLSADLLFITSHTWRAHHSPQRCFEVQGYSVGEMTTWLIQPDFAVQHVLVETAAQPLSALYWFQNDTRTTADYATRLWDDARLQPNRWTLVAVLFDRTVTADETASLLLELRAVVAQTMPPPNSRLNNWITL